MVDLAIALPYHLVEYLEAVIYVRASIRKKTLSIIISVLAWEQLVNTQIHCFARFYR